MGLKNRRERLIRNIQLSKVNTQRLINKNGNETPIILIGNSVGAVQTYKKADLNGHPFYHAPIFIHFYTTEKNKTLSLDIWQLAQKCINDINNVFPSGPYIIMGRCANSPVAHEVACQLTSTNKEVELLVMIDENWDKKETAPVADKQTRGTLSLVKKQINEMNELGFMYIFKKIISRIKDKIHYYYTSLDSIKEHLYIMLGKPVPEAIQFRVTEKIFYEACESNPYTPMPYYGRVLLFDSKNWVEKYAPKLRTFYKGEVKKIDVDTTHSGWFKPERIKMIIKEIEGNTK